MFDIHVQAFGPTWFIYTVVLSFDVAQIPLRMREKGWGPDSFEALADRIEVLSRTIAERWDVATDQDPKAMAMAYGDAYWRLDPDLKGSRVKKGADFVRFFNDVIREIRRLGLMNHVVRERV